MEDQDISHIYLHLASDVYIFSIRFHIWKIKLINPLTPGVQ